MSAERYNEGKPHWALVPQSALIPMVRVLEYGAKKYTRLSEGFKTPVIELLNNLQEIFTVSEIGDIYLVTEQVNFDTTSYIPGVSIIVPSGYYLKNITDRNNEFYIPIEDQACWKHIKYPVRILISHKDGYSVLILIRDYENIACILKQILSELHPELEDKLAEVFAKDYGFQDFIISGRDNWKKGLPILSICESLKRHLDAFMEGQNNDPESGLNHVGHIQANALFLAWMLENKPEFDDRIVSQIEHNKVQYNG